MESRNHEEMGNNNPVRYTPPMVQESPSPVKLPLSARRGTSIFSPAHHHQTLDHRPRNPPRLSPLAAAAPDPDPTAAAPSKSSPIRYRECLKNHAASAGAHVVDGCGEFMPGGEDGTADSLRCAACDCHRNFHRKESDGDPPPQSRRTPAAQPPRHRFASPPVMVSFGGGAAAESSSGHAAGARSKKRFRTKFRQEQKDRMHEFALKAGWRIPRDDEEEVHRFCGEVGVTRQVLKVWMHNNKPAMNKRSDKSTDHSILFVRE